jgi:hypothetical protein
VVFHRHFIHHYVAFSALATQKLAQPTGEREEQVARDGEPTWRRSSEVLMHKSPYHDKMKWL